MKKLFIFFLVVFCKVICAQDIANKRPAYLTVPVYNAINNKDGSSILYFKLHPFISFSGTANFFAGNIKRKVTDTLISTTNLEVVRTPVGGIFKVILPTSNDLFKLIKSKTPLAIYTVGTFMKTPYDGLLYKLFCRGISLKSNQNYVYNQMDQLCELQITEETEEEYINTMMRDINLEGKNRIANKVKDVLITQGKFKGIYLNNVLEVTNREHLKSFLLELEVNKLKYNATSIKVTDEYISWILNGCPLNF